MRHRWIFCLAILALAAAPGSGAERISNAEPYVSEVVVPHVFNGDLRSFDTVASWNPGDPIEVVPEGLFAEEGSEGDPSWVDPVRQDAPVGGDSLFAGEVVTDFQAMNFTGALPPDVVGDVGPDHYIAMANASRFSIFDKDGNVLAGPLALNTLWTGGSSPCTDGDGDPIVRYDGLADRWFMTEFDLTGNTFCWYVSQGPNPVTDGWFVYDFSAPSFPDYPQYGVWPGAYFVTTFESPSLGLYAFDRNQMLNGDPATYQRFTVPQLVGSSPRVTRMLPADVDGTTAPLDGDEGLFARTVDATQDNTDPTDRIEMFAFFVDFVTPANSSLSQMNDVIPESFTLLPCSPTVRDCVPQPGTSRRLDALFNRSLRRLQFRRFGDEDRLVTTQVVDAGGGIAGKRWYELRRTITGDFPEGSAPFSIHQQGTYSPDSVERFMGSIAQNGRGDIALGYSVSDATSTLPGIRVTARRSGDPLGEMTMEELEIKAGEGVQTSTQRWGDYTSMNVDPADDDTFWYVNQFVRTNGTWATYVGAIRLTGLIEDGFESGDTSAWSDTVP